MKKQIALACLFGVLGFSISLFATEAEGPCVDCAVEENKSVGALMKVANAVKTGNSKWIDAYFMAETKVTGKELDVVFKNPQDLKISDEALVTVNNHYFKFLGQTNLQEALKYTKTFVNKLSHEEKLLFLSILGSKLSAGYSATTTENKDLEAVYQNAVKAEKEGGICGDIHKLLGEVARNLGFEAVGRHTGQWQQDLTKDDAGGHAIMHFRDPKTGEYYVQNYSQIYNTKQKTLQSAVDVSSKVMGVLTGTQYVESRPGKVHEYVPATAQWVQDQIQGVARFKPDQAAFTIKASQNEQTLAAQFGNDTAKGFVLGTKVMTGEGVYRLEAAGVSARTGASIITDGMLIDEVKGTAEVYGGALKISAPGFDARTQSFRDGERSSLFFGSNLKGSARINNTTGKIEINTEALNIASGARTELKAGLEHEFKELNLKVSADRTWSWQPIDIEQKFNGRMTTTYDRIGVMYDTSNPDKKEAYLVVGTDVYLLEGVNVSSAVALKNSIKAVIPTEKLGTFSVGADLGRIVSNKSKDPFYDTVPVSSVHVDWSKKISKLVEVGASVSRTRGNQITPFGVIGPIGPVMGKTEKKVQGMVYLHAKF